MSEEAFTELGQQLDAESWDWLQVNALSIADAVQAAVRKGATPEAVKVFVLNQCGQHRKELAIRCQSAARYLRGGRG